MEQSNSNSQVLPSYIKGTCQDMCPKDERIWREKERLIHILEINTDKKKKANYKRHVVKCFHRSAAGQRAPRPSDLRPSNVLLTTVYYLLTDVVSDKTVNWLTVYNFVFDRLRAVRQDVVIQSLGATDIIPILEPIVRFHVYASYRLCNEPPSEFDSTINNTHLRECLKRLLSAYDEEKCSKMSANRAEMEALYVLLNLKSCDAFYRAQRIILDFRLNKSHMLVKAVEISLAWWNGNYVRVSRSYKELPPIHSCAISFHLPQLRRHALQVMSVAYSCRNSSYPVSLLRNILCYSSEEDVIQDCSLYGVLINDDSIKFLKGNFNYNSQQGLMRHEDFIDAKISTLDLPQLLISNKSIFNYGDDNPR